MAFYYRVYCTYADRMRPVNSCTTRSYGRHLGRTASYIASRLYFALSKFTYLLNYLLKFIIFITDRKVLKAIYSTCTASSLAL